MTRNDALDSLEFLRNFYKDCYAINFWLEPYYRGEENDIEYWGVHIDKEGREFVYFSVEELQSGFAKV